MPTRAELKQRAKDSMRASKPSIYIISLVYYLALAVMESLSLKLTYPGLSSTELVNAMLSGNVDLVTASSPSGLGSILSIALSIMTIMLAVGFTIVCLRVSRAVAVGVGDLFDGFAHFGKFLWLEILTGIYVFLWSLLFVVPGIVASYRYRMAVYIMIENPEYSASECIRRSKEMMQGHKWELFVLDLSFILWGILASIPFVSVYVQPYMQTTEAHYYNALSGYSVEADYTVVDEDNGGWNNKKDPWE